MKTVLVVCAILALCCGVLASEIHDAAREGNLERVKTLLAGDPELIKTQNETGASPLHAATYNGQVAVAEYLISSGADINARTTSGSTPLHGAAFYNHPDCVKLLITKGANANASNNFGYVPLLSASAAGNVDIVDALLSAGADTSARITDGGVNALGMAAFSGNQKLVELLLKRGFDIRNLSQTGDNFLHLAVMSDSIALVRMGLERGLGPESVNNMGETPLHHVFASVMQRGMSQQKIDICNLLLKSGADIDSRDNQGYTPLLRAVMTQDTTAVSVMINAGADVNIGSNDGVTPLMEAVESGNSNLVSQILRKNANVDARESHYGNTALHLAVHGGKLESVQALISHVKSINIEDNNKWTALDIANNYGHKQIAALLKSKGGKGNQKAGDSNVRAVLNKAPEPGRAELWYMGHCGWAIRTQNHLMVFDYFRGRTSPTDLSLANGYVNPEEIKDLNVEVFVSHNHTDHFDSTIFGLLPAVKNLTYVFGFKPEELPDGQRQGFNGQPYEYIGPREVKNLDGMRICTIGSNEGGVGFLIEADGLKIFHAGDHAGWENDNSQPYTSEIDYLDGLTDNVDMAFINTTGCRFSRDTLALQQSVFYAIEKLSPAVTVPTHGMGREYVYREYAGKIKEQGFKTEVLCADYRGDHFVYSKNGKSAQPQ